MLFKLLLISRLPLWTSRSTQDSRDRCWLCPWSIGS